VGGRDVSCTWVIMGVWVGVCGCVGVVCVCVCVEVCEIVGGYGCGYECVCVSSGTSRSFGRFSCKRYRQVTSTPITDDRTNF
jgi:hypothetical protein